MIARFGITLFAVPLLAQTVVLQHARVIDGTGHAPYPDASLVVKDGRVAGINAAVTDNARTVDCAGKTIIPGLINAHGHLGVTKGNTQGDGNFSRENVEAQLNQYARFGVTSVLALGLAPDLIYELRDAQRKGDFAPDGASIFTAGRGIGVPNGAPPIPVPADQVYRPATPEEARTAVRETAAHHPDIIKIWVDDLNRTNPKMKPEIWRAVIDEAHKNRLRVAAHVYYLADARSLVDAGVDVLAHSIRDKQVDSGLLSAMKSHNVIYIPTLELEDSFFQFADHPDLLQQNFLDRALDPSLRDLFFSRSWRDKIEQDPATALHRKAFDQSLKNLKAVYQAGVMIAMGTDSGATPLRVQGWAEHVELELMVQAGLSPMDVLVAATRNSANALGSNERGTLEAGHAADFLVLDANPLESIRNTQSIYSVWRNGSKLEQLIRR